MARETPSFYPDDPVCTKPDEFDYDVIIVGSGLAGLSAAYNVMQKKCGITVLVLEGSDKIGGRLGISGATRGYFIDDRQTHINRLISELGVKLSCRRQLGSEKRVYYSRNGPVVHQPKKTRDQINDFINGLDFTAASIDLKTYADYPQAKKLATLSLDALIQRFITDFEAQEFMKAITYAICGVEAASVSALWFIVMAIGAGGLKRRIKFALGTNRRKFFSDGASKILEKLSNAIGAERIEIRTNSVVDLIEFNDVCTYVSVCDGEQFKCEYVIVAVPPPENSKIRISPSPNSEILRNQKSHKSGKGTFFLAIYDQAWWLRDNYSGDIISSKHNDCDFRLVYEATCPEIALSPVFLAGFLKGCVKKKSSHPLELLRKCWTHRRRVGENNSELVYSTKLKSYTEWKWPGENEATGLTDGGYPTCAMKPSNIKNHMNPMLVPHERVYWACSEYARYWPGTLDGAVESGGYAAISIMFHLRPQSLNSGDLRFITPDTVATVKNQLPLDLVALHFFVTGIVTAILILYCKPVQHSYSRV